jgi:hypothetical protein
VAVWDVDLNAVEGEEARFGDAVRNETHEWPPLASWSAAQGESLARTRDQPPRCSLSRKQILSVQRSYILRSHCCSQSAGRDIGTQAQPIATARSHPSPSRSSRQHCRPADDPRATARTTALHGCGICLGGRTIPQHKRSQRAFKRQTQAQMTECKGMLALAAMLCVVYQEGPREGRDGMRSTKWGLRRADYCRVRKKRSIARKGRS